MTFNRVKITNPDGSEIWKFDLTNEPIGCWYDSHRGIYLIPDILIDAIDNGFESTYNYLVSLHNEHPEVFSDEYQDVRNIILLDEFIYDEYTSFEQWINNHDLFLIPDGYYIGMHPDYGDFGMYSDSIDNE